MGELLSQAEIDALLKGASSGEAVSNTEEELLPQEIDAIGEMGNISMGTASTTLFTLLHQKVLITTPRVEVTTWDELCEREKNSYVAVRAEFTDGLQGTNLLLLKERDAKVITDLMMGGDGTNIEGELTDLHLSAIGEAMNQMIGSSATSLSSMFNRRVEISPPRSFKTQLDSSDFSDFDGKSKIVRIAFKMEIGDLVDSEIMQLLPIKFAKEMVNGLINTTEEPEVMSEMNSISGESISQPGLKFEESQSNQESQSQMYQQQSPQQYYNEQPNMQPQYEYAQQDSAHNQIHLNMGNQQRQVNIQPIQYQSFEEGRISGNKEAIALLMDVPLQVTVELGRTHKLIKDILEFAPGSIIELDKLAGELVDILVNGKIIAKGEVVIIDESFGVRISEIVQPSKRL